MLTYFNRIINFTGDFFVGVRVRVLEGTASLCSAVIKSVEHTHTHTHSLAYSVSQSGPSYHKTRPTSSPRASGSVVSTQ